jgi:hypothetical protein
VHKLLHYGTLSIMLIAINRCNAALEAAAAAASSIGIILQTSQQVTQLLGHHKKQPQPVEPGFLEKTKQKLIEQGSDFTAGLIIKSADYAACAAYNALTKSIASQQPGPIQQQFVPPQAQQPPVIIINKLRTKRQRHVAYSSGESSSSSSESDTERDYSPRRHYHHKHYHHRH